MKTALLAAVATLASWAVPAAAQDYRQRLPQDEVIYFVLPDRFDNGDTANDRGGLTGDRLATGFDPSAKGFYHGGDLKGLIRRLDYIQGLGATALWVGPIFKNKPVQGGKGQESAGYHGYWITDFTRVDPHFGTDADFRALVDAAHARGMKVYMDIIANHTADVIQYRECGEGKPCPYRDRATYPYRRKGGMAGKAINPGFLGDDVQTAENFARLTDPTYAYTPYVPAAERQMKVPAWLNDPIYYHNRGDTLFRNESSQTGDFSGLDDLMTENPRVIAGMIDIYGGWIDRFGIDGFRIDTAKHVNPEFWRSFVPAMQARAAARGIPNFHIFGEVTAGMEPGYLARWTKIAGYPAVLDFAFQNAVMQVVAENKPTSVMADLFEGDVLYAKGEATADILPTFLGNHDQGRFARWVRLGNPNAPDAEVLKRVELAHAMLLTLRGVPTLYSGDEQGFAGDGNDQDAREDLFASRVASYNDNRLVGTTRTTAQDNFQPDHPLYRTIASLARLRTATPALTRGRQVTRQRGDGPGLFAVSRFDSTDGHEVVIAFNTAATPITQAVQVEVKSERFTTLAGPCPATAAAPGSLTMTLPAFGYAVCSASPSR
ncbi:glycosidase [Sphingomonas sp. SORGH_AS802]|uniref:alpha-amylase family glycosyl hydrolase n=1 Tax=unclassified Sphingomonas TaxID=196159 RepID=UPI0028604912|nr:MULTISPECIES: alpha-amylase family glycosyl hydrolase [unclassified Sphingomonas]MDR6126208.1 glycosidase [Sphingomonas sp. SORGH_AS_0438]MDR6135946.1 glycosidase [Sphingomonas sp. SORGH_AS_0802]